MAINASSQAHFQDIFKNLSLILDKINQQKNNFSDKSDKNQVAYDDSGNAYMYILFVLTFYAFSILILMVKYIRYAEVYSMLSS